MDEELKKLAERQRAFRSKGKKKRPRPEPKSWFYPSMLHDGPGHELAIILPTRGCHHYFSESVGCYMCGYNNDSLGECTSGKNLVHQFEEILENRSEEIETSNKIVLKIFNSGSFLDKNEIPVDAFNGICNLIAEKENIVEVAVESRPEFITEEHAMKLKESFRDDQLVEIGIGLETWDDLIREKCINKGFSLENFLSASNILSSYDLGTKVYVFLKPLFLSEREAYLDAISTLEKVARLDVSTISINPAAIHSGTLMEYFFNRYKYFPPKLWSVQYVVNTALKTLAKHPNTLLICDPVAAGKPRGAHNCKDRECNQNSIELIKDSLWQKTSLDGLDPLEVDVEGACTCYLDWLDEMGL